MLKKYFLLLMMFFVTLLPAPVEGFYCKNIDKANQRYLASNINTIYFEKINGDKATFDIKIANITKNLIVKDVYNNKLYSYGHDKTNPSEITISNFPHGNSYKFEIYTDIEFCEDELLHVVYVTVPRYNVYHKDELCKGISDYRFCQRWVDFEVSYNEFVKNVEDYKKSLIIEDIEEPIIEDKLNLYDYLINFWIKYYYYILGGIIIICLILLYILYKKNDLKIR